MLRWQQAHHEEHYAIVPHRRYYRIVPYKNIYLAHTKVYDHSGRGFRPEVEHLGSFVTLEAAKQACEEFEGLRLLGKQNNNL